MVALLKQLLKKIPIAFTRNQRYDAWTKKIINTRCTASSNCIDIGTHKGEIMDLFLKRSPQGLHFGFEPLPHLFDQLTIKYAQQQNCRLYRLALSDRKEQNPFNHVLSNPAYSGLRKRQYDRPYERDETITVQTDLLDNIIPADLPVQLIKIDVEGGELDVLKGAERILASYKPLVIFECGLGGSDVYGVTPEKVMEFYERFGYRIYLLKAFLDNRRPLSLEEFHQQFYGRKNYYFIAA